MNLLNNCHYFYKSNRRRVPNAFYLKEFCFCFFSGLLIQVESWYEEIFTQMRFSTCQEPASIWDPDPEKLYNLKCSHGKASKSDNEIPPTWPGFQVFTDGCFTRCCDAGPHRGLCTWQQWLERTWLGVRTVGVSPFIHELRDLGWVH